MAPLTRTPQLPLQMHSKEGEQKKTRAPAPLWIFTSPRREKFLGSLWCPPRSRSGWHSPTLAAPQRRRSCWPWARVTSLQRARGPRSAHARQPIPPHCIVLSSRGSARRPLARPALQQPKPRPSDRLRPSRPSPGRVCGSALHRTSRRQRVTPGAWLVLNAETPSTSKQTFSVPSSKSSPPG